LSSTAPSSISRWISANSRGVPRSIFRDGSANVADDEFGYAVSRFTSLRPRAR